MKRVIKVKLQLICILFLIILGGCQANSPFSNDASQNKKILIVSAAVSLRDAFNEIADLYKSKTGVTVNFNFGASGVLQKQIETGAPVDVFASAGAQQMDELAGRNLIETTTRRNFARNTLVLIVQRNSKLNLTSFQDLTNAEIQKIAVGNPKTVPAGQYTDQLFDKNNLKNILQSKLILAEDVRQVLDYVARGEVDAGIVYASDARVANEKVRIAATAPEDSHAPIVYPIAIVRESENNSEQKQTAQEFIDFILSAEGQTILQKYGFASVSEQ